MPKRKCVFNEDLKKKYPFIKHTFNESNVFCKHCSGNFSIAAGGNDDIVRHLKAAKHLNALSAAANNHNIDSFFALSNAPDRQMAIKEGVWAFHTISESHSFR